MENKEGISIDFNEPNETSARKSEMFEGEVDSLKDLVATWLKYQPQSKGNSVKFKPNKDK